MANRHLTVSVALAIGVAAAGPATAVMPVTPQTYARLGQTITVGGYAVTPRAVLEDSRCPPVVTCVWSGQVRLSIRVVSLHGHERYLGEMTTMRPLQLRRGNLQILSVTPPNPANGRHVRPGDYRFGFRLTAR